MSCIPLPQNHTITDGCFVMDNQVQIVVGKNIPCELGDLLNEYLHILTGISVELCQSSEVNHVKKTIVLQANQLTKGTSIDGVDESYTINITPESINIASETTTGIARAIQLLRQLFVCDKDVWSVPAGVILDEPEFKWRGLHLDVSRHFFTVDEVCKFIDTLAYHRMNVCHLHLTDDQGWRIEIKKYPKLTSVGSKRDCSLIGHESERPRKYDTKIHEGFYTQEDIKQIVSFATQRHITIVPEIDMPGHMQAAISAYPEWGCTNEFQSKCQRISTI